MSERKISGNNKLYMDVRLVLEVLSSVNTLLYLLRGEVVYTLMSGETFLVFVFSQYLFVNHKFKFLFCQSLRKSTRYNYRDYIHVAIKILFMNSLHLESALNTSN